MNQFISRLFFINVLISTLLFTTPIFSMPPASPAVAKPTPALPTMPIPVVSAKPISMPTVATLPATTATAAKPATPTTMPGMPTTAPAPVVATVATQPIHMPTPTPPTTIKESLSFHKKELIQIDASLKAIQASKAALKKQLSELDTKIGDAQNKATEAKDIGFNVLQKDTEKNAQADLDKIKKLIADIKIIREFIDSSFAQTFHENITAIKVQIALIDQTIKTLQAQYPTVTLGELAKEQPATVTTPATEKPRESKTIENTLAKFTAWLINSLKQIKDWMLSPAAIEEQKKKSIADKNAVSGPVKEQVNKDIELINKSIEELDKKNLTYSTMYQELKELIKELRARFDSVPVIQAYLLLTEHEQKPTEKLYWRRIAQHIFDKLLDLVAIIFELVQNLTVKFYHNYIAGTINRFKQDVQEKIADMEIRKAETESL
ncbi:hypothetical protein IPF37_01475 [bacterium]|nr:MAG: hypothetical protein IPF37_01475 [bacterium]